MEITKNIHETVELLNKESKEKITFEEDSLEIKYFPQALFKVKSVSRCTSSLPGK
jgi:hypothetical protein